MGGPHPPLPGRIARRGDGFLGEDRSSNGVEDALGDVGNLAEAVDLAQQTAFAVDVGQRLGLFGIDVETVTHDLFAVVAATFGLGPCQQACDDLVDISCELDDMLSWARRSGSTTCPVFSRSRLRIVSASNSGSTCAGETGRHAQVKRVDTRR